MGSFNYLQDPVSEQFKERAGVLVPWLKDFFCQPSSYLRPQFLSAPIPEAFTAGVARGTCLTPHVQNGDLLFYDPNAQPQEGDFVAFEWEPEEVAEALREYGTAFTVKVLRFVDGHPLIACNTGLLRLHKDAKILGVLRAVRLPAQINYVNDAPTLFEGGRFIRLPIDSTLSATCRDNYVGHLLPGAVAYWNNNSAGTLNGNTIENPRGATSNTGAWNYDGTGNATTTQLGDKTSNVNTYGKYYTRRVLNSSNNRLMFAVGSAVTDNWAYCDGNAPATITPS